MSRSDTTRDVGLGFQARLRRRRRSERWGLRAEWLLGGLFVVVGALSGAFGTVAWLTALCAPTLRSLLVGVIAMGIAPVIGGGALLWAGLGMLETATARARVRAFSDEHVIGAADGGATASTVAGRLGTSELREVTRRLDDLVTRELLSLEITEEGELLYHPTPAAG